MGESVKRALASGWPTAGVLAVGLVVAVHQGSLVRAGRGDDELATVAQVRDLIVENWVEDPAPRRERMRYGAVEGMAAQLDPYSVFIPPEEKQRFEEDTNGEFGGLGILIDIDKGKVVVLTPLEDTPAWAAGLLPDDRVLEIDGHPYDVQSRDDAMKKLRGRPGSGIQLLVSNPRVPGQRTVTLARAMIKVQSVKGARIVDPDVSPDELAASKAPRIGYLSVSQFQEPTLSEFDRAIADLTSAGMTAFVLDLRGNPGGYLNTATDMAARFLDKGATVVVTRGRGGRDEKKTLADPPAEAPRIRCPVAVLVDGGSASASEVLSGALRDNGKATLVGTRSFGKGSVQSILPIDDGKAKLKLTTQYYYTPSLRKIHRVEKATEKDEWGLIPDLVVPLDPKDRAEVLKQDYDLEVATLRHRRDPSLPRPAHARVGPDAQLDAAIEHLKRVVRGEARIGPQPLAVGSAAASAPVGSGGRVEHPQGPGGG